MGFFDRLFGKKATSSASLPDPAPAPPPFDGLVKKPVPPPAKPPEAPEMMRAHDAYGREIQIPRQQWLESVIMGNIEKAWNDPDKLASMIMGAFNDGFFAEMVKPAEHLAEIDPNPQRMAALLSISYLKTGRVDDAGRVLDDHISQHGESGVILTNLAKVYAERSEEKKAEKTLWRALELDPNQENALNWYQAELRNKHGEDGEQIALKQVAALPGSWRAQLWLARKALQKGVLEDAISLYRESLATAGAPVPADLLMQMSGDLGKQAHILELLDLTAPHFRPEHHGIMVGNNILKAYLDLGQIEAARVILDQLYALKRPDWKEPLNFWETEIAKTRLQTTEGESPDKLQLTLANIDGPVWLNTVSPAAELFQVREEDGPTICFLCASVAKTESTSKAGQQLADAAGRLSRGLPLFFAEQMYWRSDAQVTTLIPRVVGPQGAFAIMGVAWEDEAAARFSRQSEVKYDYAVTAHLDIVQSTCKIDLRVIRTIDGTCLKTLSASFPKDHPESAIPDLTEKLYQTLIAETGASATAGDPAYAIPTTAALPAYLIRLEQLLGARCAATQEMKSGFLHGERDILDGMIQIALVSPESISVRVLMTQCFQTMKRVRPDILPEFEEKVSLLQKQYPLAGVAQGVIDRLLRDLFAQ